MHQSKTHSLIPRARLFGNPTRAQAKISPDGQWLSWLAPKDGVLNIWIAPVSDRDAARVITDDKKRGIRFHAWSRSSSHASTCRTKAAPRSGTFSPSTSLREPRAT